MKPSKAVVKEALDEGEMPEEEQMEKDSPEGDIDDTGDMHSSSEEVPVSEAFQKHAHKMIKKANKHHIQHIRSKLNEREDEMRKEEMAKEKKGKGKIPDEFSTEAAPAGLDV